MKRFCAVLIAVLLMLSLGVTALADAGVEIIGGGASATSGSLEVGEQISIDKLCDFTVLGYVADTYAFSIPAYERPEDETVQTPEVPETSEHEHWYNRDRYKFKKNSSNDAGSYADMYTDIGAAKKASTDDYMLLDVRVSVLNRMITPMDLAAVFDAKAIYMDDYEFPLTYLCVEKTDELGNANEWLSDDVSVPMLVEKNAHFIIEIPNIVATSTDPLSVILTVNGEEYELVIR